MTDTPENNKLPKRKSLPPLQIDPDLDPIYANLVRLTHSPTEVVLDFARLLPGGSPPRVYSRILMTPLSAKLFYKALGEHLAKYETSYGEITIPGGTSSLADHLFRPPQPPNDEE
jgi:hypothetical protein